MYSKNKKIVITWQSEYNVEKEKDTTHTITGIHIDPIRNKIKFKLL